MMLKGLELMPTWREPAWSLVGKHKHIVSWPRALDASGWISPRRLMIPLYCHLTTRQVPRVVIKKRRRHESGTFTSVRRLVYDVRAWLSNENPVR